MGRIQKLGCNLDFSTGTNLKTIGSSAFSESSNLKSSLAFPASLTTIEDSAFYRCPYLGTVPSFPNAADGSPSRLNSIGNYAFQGCSLQGALVVPNSLETIGNYAFAGSNGIKNPITALRIDPQSSRLRTIGYYAFTGQKPQVPGQSPSTYASCNISEPLTFPATIKNIGDHAFMGNSIPSVTFAPGASSLYVNDYAFSNNLIANDPVSNVGYKDIGAYCFAYNDLTAADTEHLIDLSDSAVITPKAHMFDSNPSITDLILSNKWSFVPAGMFANNTGLQTIVFPKTEGTLRYVGASAFQNCTSLETVDFGQARLQDDAYRNKAIGKSAFQGCVNLKTVDYSKASYPLGVSISITSDDYAFEGCKKLYDVRLPGVLTAGSEIVVNMGNYAFANTDLGNFPIPGSVIEGRPQGIPLGYLPLDQRSVGKIGSHAFENAGLKEVKLPTTLTSIGDHAFANNHMTGLELPNNAALDSQGHVGADVLAGQTVDAPAIWGDSKTSGKADVILEALHALGIVHDRVDSVGLNVPNVGDGILPDNDWRTDHRATYDKSSVETPGATFTYGYEIWRTGGTGPLSHGDVTLAKMQQGLPVTFYYYADKSYAGEPEKHVQWVGKGQHPVEESCGMANFGLDKAGYHTQPGAYDPSANAGWRTGPGPGGTGSPMDPAQYTASIGDTQEFYNCWIPNSYSVSFDDNWDWMVQQDARLGVPDPGGSGGTVRNPDYVKGSTDGLPNLAYGEPAALSDNGFQMGSYGFAGWATSSDLAEADRVPGANFFSPGSSIATPDPAPADGATVTLYAQWKAVDMGADSPALLGFLSIPQHVSMESSGGRLYSQPTTPDAGPEDHAVVVSAAPELPGATWPNDAEYRVSVTRPGAGEPLLALSGDGASRAIDVLAPDGQGGFTPYDPGVNDADDPGAVPTPLMTIDPKDDARSAASFVLRSVDPIGMFEANVRYAGTMTFRVDIVQKGAAS